MIKAHPRWPLVPGERKETREEPNHRSKAQPEPAKPWVTQMRKS